MKVFAAAIAATGILAGLVVAAEPSSAAAGPSGFVPAPVTWSVCADETLHSAGVECALLEVPLDYADPGGEKISIGLSRLSHTVSPEKYQGVILTGPGGPGAPGLRLVQRARNVPNGVGAAYDWIGIDQRGVGTSRPTLVCTDTTGDHPLPQQIPSTPQIEQTWLARSKAFADGCKAAQPRLIEHMKTTDLAQDLESIRQALGQRQINYYGVSYSNYLAQVYSTMYPDKVRRMVFDGNYDPDKLWYKANLAQNVPIEGNIKKFFAWIAQYDNVYHLGTSGPEVEKLYYRTLAELRGTPVGQLGSVEFNEIFTRAANLMRVWQPVAEGFSAAIARNDYQPLTTLYGFETTSGPGSFDNANSATHAVECSDVSWPKDRNQWRADMWASYAKTPFYTWNNAWFMAPCSFWGVKPGKLVKVDGSRTSGALLISETFDGENPIDGSLEVRSRFPRSALVEGVGGTNHGSSLQRLTPCIDNAIADYLATGKLPERKPGRTSDLQCSPMPQPVPAG